MNLEQELFTKYQNLKKSISLLIHDKYFQNLKDIPIYNYDEVLNQLNSNLSLSFLRTNFYEVKAFFEYEKKLKELRSQVVLTLSNEIYLGLTRIENVDKVNNLSAILQELGNICLKYSTTQDLKFNLQLLIDSFFNTALGILNSEDNSER